MKTDTRFDKQSHFPNYCRYDTHRRAPEAQEKPAKAVLMEKLVREQDWNQVIYDKVPRVYMPVEQKMYERQYLATFPIMNNKQETVLY